MANEKRSPKKKQRKPGDRIRIQTFLEGEAADRFARYQEEEDLPEVGQAARRMIARGLRHEGYGEK